MFGNPRTFLAFSFAYTYTISGASSEQIKRTCNCSAVMRLHCVLHGGKSRGYCATEQPYAYRESPLTAERPLHGVFFLFRATEAEDSALTAKLARDALKHT